MRSRWHQSSVVLRFRMLLLLLPLVLGTSNAAATAHNTVVDADDRACLEALQQSDLDHDFLLNRYPEYVTYLHLLSPPPRTSTVIASHHHQNHHFYLREAAGIGDNFETLSRPLQDAFEAFADSPTTTINGQQVVNISQAFLPLVDDDERHNNDGSNSHHLLLGSRSLFLKEFCQQTRQALLVGMPLTTTRRTMQDDDHLGATGKGMVWDDHSTVKHNNNDDRLQKEEVDVASPSPLPTTTTTTTGIRRLRGATVGVVAGMVESNQKTRPGDVVGAVGGGAAKLIPIDSSEAEGCGSGNDHRATASSSSSSPCSSSSYLRNPNNAKNDEIRLLQSATKNNHGDEGLASESMPPIPCSQRHPSVGGEEDDSQGYQLYHVLPPHVTTPPRHLSEENDCSLWVRFSDLDRNGALSKGDYVVLVNLMAGQSMGTEFANLPDSLQATFSRLASTSTTNAADREEGISFSNEATEDATNRWLNNIFESNNHDPTAAADANDRSAQLVPIQTICSGTRSALDAILSQDGAGDMDENMAIKGNAKSACTTKNAAIYDKNSDGKLAFDEFARFANGLRTGETTAPSSFQDLPQDVQDIFMQQAIKEFNPFGAKTDIDTISLAEKLNGGQLVVSFGTICTHADDIIHALNNHSPLEEPSHSSSSPTSMAQQEMTSQSKSSYRTELVLKDSSPHSNSSHSVPAISSMVPQVLAQANGTTAPGATTMPGTTAMPGATTTPTTATSTAAPSTPTASTAAPNNTTQGTTAAPNTNTTQATTQAPSANTTEDFTTDPNATEAPTGPQLVTGYNSWIMGNPLQMKAADLKASPDYTEIKRAYASYSSSVVDDMIADRAPRRLLRGRRLEVELQSESSRVYEVIDSLCPANLLVQEEINCVTVFGRVNIIATNESTRNVYNEYVSASQLGIEGGLLQDTLVKQSPGLFWFVDGAAKLVQPTDDFPVPPVPEEEKDWRGGTDLMTGLAISGLIAIVCVLFVCLFVLVPAARAKRETDDKKKAALFALREAEAMIRAEAAAEAAAADAALASLAERLKNSAGKKKKLGPCPGAEHDESENPYRAEVERLLTENCPDRLDELDSLLWQFKVSYWLNPCRILLENLSFVHDDISDWLPCVHSLVKSIL